MSAISWANLETFVAPPASTSTGSSGDDYTRSFLSSIATGLSTSFIWPGSGGGSAASAGISQFGNARLAVASNSAVTGGFGDGFLLLNRNHVSLHHIGSSWTGILGHSGMIDMGASSALRWLVQTGMFSLDSTIVGDSGTTKTTFPTTFASTPSFVQVQTNGANSLTAYAINVVSVSSSNFTSVFSGLRSGESFCNVVWQAVGVV